jgi:hypothetical protein
VRTRGAGVCGLARPPTDASRPPPTTIPAAPAGAAGIRGCSHAVSAGRAYPAAAGGGPKAGKVHAGMLPPAGKVAIVTPVPEGTMFELYRAALV